MKKYILLVFVGILLNLNCQVAIAESDSVQFYFIQITDTHFGASKCTEHTARLVEIINHLPFEIEFVVHTGDITSNALADSNIVKESQEVMNQLTMPVLYVPGNHDILKYDVNRYAEIYKDKYGPLLTRYEHEGVIFMGLYSNPMAKSFEYSGFDPAKELDLALKETEGKPVVVFHHIPSVEDFYLNTLHPGWETGKRTQWINILNSYNVIAVLAGHFHRDEQHWLGDVPLYVSASVADFWGRQPSYRIYEYKNGRLSYRTQYLEPEEDGY